MSTPSTPTYPWDLWAERARAAGMDPKAGAAGRAMMRECYQHSWSEYLGPRIEQICGLEDEGAAMLAFGLKYPKEAMLAWDYLTADDAGNAPGNRRWPKAIAGMNAFVFEHYTWPTEWPLSNP